MLDTTFSYQVDKQKENTMHSVKVDCLDKLDRPTDMEIGQVGIVKSEVNSLKIGDIMMRYFNGWVVLNRPRSTYSKDIVWCTAFIKILPIGTKIIIELGV